MRRPKKKIEFTKGRVVETLVSLNSANVRPMKRRVKTIVKILSRFRFRSSRKSREASVSPGRGAFEAGLTGVRCFDREMRVLNFESLNLNRLSGCSLSPSIIKV